MSEFYDLNLIFADFIDSKIEPLQIQLNDLRNQVNILMIQASGNPAPVSSGTVDPPVSSGTVDPPSSSGTVDNPTSSGTVDPPSSSGVVDPPATSGTVDPPVSSGVDTTPEPSGNPVPVPPPPGDMSIGSGSFTVMTETIPNFGAVPTIVSAQNGNWSDPLTWTPSRLPTTGDNCRINPNHEIKYDVVSDDLLASINIRESGCLNFVTDQNTKLCVGTITVEPGACMEIGTPDEPIAANVVTEIAYSGVITDAKQYGLGLLGFGMVTIQGAEKTNFIRLAREVNAGDTTLLLSDTVSGWQVGDELGLPDTRQIRNSTNQDETVKIISINDQIITIEPTKYSHFGAKDNLGALIYLPHVANLTRNIQFRSLDSKVRAHTFLMGMVEASVYNAEFIEMGRTTTAPNSSTNLISRYALHAHHLIGMPTDKPYQFEFVGNSVNGKTSSGNRRWGIDVHASHYGLIKNNVVFGHGGVGIGTEDQTETGNVFDGNFAFAIKGVTYDNSINSGNGFWISNPTNRFINNVAASCFDYGIALDFRTGGQNKSVPTQRGTMSGFVSTDINGLPIAECANNETYGGSNGGLTVWWLGTQEYVYRNVPTSYITDYLGWNLLNYGIYQYPTNELVYENPIVMGDKNEIASGKSSLIGWNGSDYYSRHVKIKNGRFINCSIGIYPTANPAWGEVLIFERGMCASKIGIRMQTPWTSIATATVVPSRTVALSGVDLSASNTQIHMSYQVTNQSNLVISDKLFIYNHNGSEDDNFRVYYTQQDENFVIPKSTGPINFNGQNVAQMVGCPEAGLTNSQAWAKYDPKGNLKLDAPNPNTPGLAIAGVVAPSGYTTRAGILGLVYPI